MNDLFDYEATLPDWTESLSEGLCPRLRKLPTVAIAKLCKLGVEHWNTVAQSVANSLQNAGFDENEMREILSVSGDAYSDTVTDRDIEKVIGKARDEAPAGGRKESGWPDFERKAVDEILGKSEILTLAQFCDSYPEPETCEPLAILQNLFSLNDWLCLGETSNEAGMTKTLKAWKAAGIEGKNFIVPSPMLKAKGRKKDGAGLSSRGFHNVSSTTFLVIEFDKLPHDEQAAIIFHLSEIAPLVMVLETGNKSLHAWFRCDGESDEERRDFMRYAVRMGADSATWTKNQFVRLPGGIHGKTGNAHEILVFRPTAAKLDGWNFDRLPETDLKTASRYSLTHHSEIAFDPVAFDFVEGILTVGGLSVVYAAPGVGKSFFVLDLAAAVSTGTAWRGREVDGGAVVYFCLEGLKGFMNRILLLRECGKLPEAAPFHVVTTGLDFFREGDVAGFIQAIRETLGGMKPRLIVIDTLARSMPGGNENAGEDMGKAIDGAGALQAAFQSHVCLVHHSGKDATRGTRGHSSLKGAVDTEIELTKDATLNVITAETTKQKDLEQGQRFPFRLIPLTVGMNNRGKAVTSCTVKHLDESEAPAKKRGGRQAQNAPGELLRLLPQNSGIEWQEAAKDELGISRANFFRLKRSLLEGVDFEKSDCGMISAPGGDFAASLIIENDT